MPLPLLAALAIKFAPALLGGIFGKQKYGVPDWFQPYMDDYKNNVIGGWNQLQADEANPGPVYRGLKQEALAAIGKGKYADQGYGPIGASVLSALAAQQAARAKGSDRQTRMNFAASGVNSGLLPMVLAQQANERAQTNEIANADAVGKVALNSVTGFQNEKRARQEYEAQLQQGKSNSYNNLLNFALGSAKIPQQQSTLSRIFTGLAGAAPGILSSLGSTNASGGANPPQQDVLFPDGDPTGTPAAPFGIESLPTMPNIPIAPIPAASSVAPSATATPYAEPPTQFQDWYKKYGRKKGAQF